MVRQLRPALVAVTLFTALCGVAYPLMLTGLAQTVFPHEADGSEVRLDGHVVGSTLVSQPFDGHEWFQPRPSAVAFDARGSGGANLAPSNPQLLDQIEERADEYRDRNDLAPGTPVPVDAVTASASGLDPHISPRNARLQASRVAATRGLDPRAVFALVEEHTERRSLGFLGEPRVNVVALNVALERLAR